MQGNHVHSGLELRLGTLSARIRTLKANVSRMEGLRKAEEGRKVAQLEKRKSDLEHLLQKLDSEDPGVRHEIKNELAKLSYDMSGAFEDFLMSVDSRYGPGSETR